MSFRRINEDIYHVGDTSTINGLDCNPYLLVDNNEAVLIDPGSVMDFKVVVKNVQEIIDLNKIKYIVVHHQDPDVASCLPLFKDFDIAPVIVTTWRAMILIQYYGIPYEYYLLDEHDFKLTLSSGREIEFIPTPYLHFPGAFVSYDPEWKVLFSSDLFGAFSYNRTFFADETYIDKMITFHEHYMPTNAILRPVMDLFLTKDIRMILPQHGAIIKDDIKKYINALRTLECGAYLNPVKKALEHSGGYVMIFNEVYKRFLSLYNPQEVRNLFESMDIFEIDSNNIIRSYEGDSKIIWNTLFNTIANHLGMRWISILKPQVWTLCETYDIPLPEIVGSYIESTGALQKELIEKNIELQSIADAVNYRQNRDIATDLYNESYMTSLFLELMAQTDWRKLGSFAILRIDIFLEYAAEYGVEAENSALQNMAYLLKSRFDDLSIFRMNTGDFGIYGNTGSYKEFIQKLETIRVEISNSDVFMGSLTVSLGVVSSSELQDTSLSPEAVIQKYRSICLNRLRIAEQHGKNYICSSGSVEDSLKNHILVADSDATNLDLLKHFISEMEFIVHTASDGDEAYKLAKEYLPSLIISEISLPKIDGYLLREKLLSNSMTKDIDMIYLSYQKDETSVKRATNLGVSVYLKKPYLLAELLGIVANYTRRKNNEF